MVQHGFKAVGLLQLVLELRQLLEAGSEGVHYMNAANGATPLWTAAAEGQEKCVELLLGAGAKVDQAKNDGFTPLIMAAQEGQSLIHIRRSRRRHR